MIQGILERVRRPASPAELLAVMLLVFLAANFLYGAVLSRLEPPAKNDFTSYYVAAHVLAKGMAGALYYPEPVGSLLAQASVQHPWIDVAREAGVANPNYYLYPPLFAIAMLPLAFVPYGPAFALWLGINVLLLAASLWIFLAGRRERSLLVPASCALLAGAFYPVWHHLKIGQSSLLVLLLLAATLALLIRRRDTAAGLVLAVAILLKLTPGILLALLVMKRRWRAVGAAVAGVLALTLLSSLVTGVQPQVTYFGKMVPLLGSGTAFYPNQSLNGFLTRLLDAGDYRKADLSLDLQAPRILATALAAGVVILSLLAIARRRRGGESREALEDGFATLVVASLLVSPISWEHHYVIILLPAWILIRRWGDRGASSRPAVVATGVALALTGSYIGLRVFEKFGPGPLGPLLSSAAFTGGLVLWWIFLTGRSAAAAEAGAKGPGNARNPGRGMSAQTALLTVIAIFASVQFLFKVAEYNTSFRYGDFTSYYVASAAVLEGSREHLYAPHTPDRILAKAESPSVWRSLADERGVEDANYYLYPPFFAVAAVPLAWLPYDRAHDLWYVVNLACLAGSLLVFIRCNRRRLTSVEMGGAVILTALLWPALFTFGAGQANYIVLLLVVAGLAAAERSRDGAAGLALAGATAIKLTPGLLLLWFLWKGRYRLVAWGAAGVAVLSLSGVPVVGWAPYRTYITEMVPLLSSGCAHWVNQSAAAFLSRLGGADMFDWSLTSGQEWVPPFMRILSLLLVGLLAWLTRSSRGEGEVPLGFALVLVTTLFISPISWIHHTVLTLPALFILIRQLIATGRLDWLKVFLLAGGYTLVAVYFKPPGFFQPRLMTPLASYHLAGNFLIWIMIATELLHLQRTHRHEGAA
jgi:hypothetical protein